MNAQAAGRLNGRTALVFGAGSSGPGWGNGKAAAVMYAREGARVVAVDVDAEAAAETAAIIAGEGGTALALAADVTSGEQVAETVREAQEWFGHIDVLHNNVGITDMGALEDITEARWRRVMDVNLTGVFLTCRAVIPMMQRQGRGAIVNISSIAGAAINRYPYFSVLRIEGRTEPFHPRAGRPICQAGDPGERDHARRDGHAAGPHADRGPIRGRRGNDSGASRHEPDGPHGRRAGTSLAPLSSSRPTRRPISPACACPSMAG